MDKKSFQSYCDNDAELPLFLRYHWISAVARPEEWGVTSVGDQNSPKGFLVYYMKQKYGFKKITLPPLTPFLGPWIIYPEGQKQAHRYGYEKKVMEELIDQLPPYDDLALQFHPSVRNWLPFYWKNFDQTLRYTYQIDTSPGTEALFGELRSNIRGKVRKAQKKVKVIESDRIDFLHDLRIKDYEDKGIRLTYSRAYFGKIDDTLAPLGQRKLFYAEDEKGRTHAGIYLVFGPDTCYYLIGAVDPEFKNDGAMSLLVWKGIEEAASRGLTFDFEGSMIEPIEQFFRSFGSEQVPFHRVERTPSFLVRSKKAFFHVLKG